MSSITQARLAPITQRYMSISLRSLDWGVEKSASASPCSQPASQTTSQINEHLRCLESCDLHRKPKLTHDLQVAERERKYPERIREYSRRRFNVGSGTLTARLSQRQHAISAEHQHKSEQYSSRFQACTYLSHRHELSLMDHYPLKAGQKVDSMFSVNEALNISKITTSSHDDLLTQCLRHGRGRGRQSESDNQASFNHRPFYVSLAVLGLFRKPSEREIEEGRAQLSDEQKIKKMKPIELKIAKGVLSMCDQEFGRANQLFHEALHMAQDEKDEEQENLVINLIAANYFESGDLENAEKLFIEIMKRMIAQDVAPTAPPILELSLKLASIYSKNPATHAKALKGFKFVINSLLYNLEDIVNNIEEFDIQSISAERKDQLALLGWSYDWFAKHLIAMNDYSGATDMLQRAVQISSLVLGPLHDQTLILLNDIGTTLAMNNSLEEGKIFIRKAVEGAIANQSKELASFYVNLGLVNLKLSKLDEAKRYCEYSMELAKKNRDHYNTQEVIELSRTCLNEVQRLLDAEGP